MSIPRLLLPAVVLLLLWPSPGLEAGEEAGEEAGDGLEGKQQKIKQLEVKQVEAFVRDLQQAARERDVGALRAAFDFEAVLEAWGRLGYFHGVPEKRRAAVLEKLGTKLRDAVLHPALVVPFRSFEIRSLRDGPTPDTFVAYVRMISDDQTLTKVYLHLRRRGDKLGLFDIEDLDTGLGFTTLIGTLLVEASSGDSKTWRNAMERIEQAQALMAAEEFSDAYDLVAAAEAYDMPDVLHAIVQMMLAACSLGAGEAAQTIEHANQAEELKAETPVLHFLRAVAWNVLDEHQKALKASRTYIAQVDEDPDINLELGKALHGLGRKAEALAPLRKIVARVPIDYEALTYLACCLPRSQHAEVAPLFEELQDVESVFPEMAELCIEEADAPALRLFTDLFAKTHPDDVQVPYYRGRAFLIEDKAEEAARVLAQALGRFAARDKSTVQGEADAERREAYIQAWLEAMALQKKHLVAFEGAPDRRLAFMYLADGLSLDENADLLMELVARAGGAEDLLPWRRYYTAQVHFLRGQFGQAAQILTPLRKELSPRVDQDEALLDLIWDVEDRLIRATVRTADGDLEAALTIAREIGARDDDWDYVVMVLAHQGNAQGAIEAMAKAIDDEQDARWLFDDEDLRKLLSGAAYKKARTKYLPDR